MQFAYFTGEKYPSSHMADLWDIWLDFQAIFRADNMVQWRNKNGTDITNSIEEFPVKKSVLNMKRPSHKLDQALI